MQVARGFDDETSVDLLDPSGGRVSKAQGRVRARGTTAGNRS